MISSLSLTALPVILLQYSAFLSLVGMNTWLLTEVKLFLALLKLPVLKDFFSSDLKPNFCKMQ